MPQELENEENMIDRHVFEPIYKNPEAIGKTGRVFWFSRHGESENNLFGKIGGDTSLSTNGEKYATLLAAYINQMELDDLQVWHSDFVRTKQTASQIRAPKFAIPQLNEINAGLHDNMTYEEIALHYPKDFAQRDQDKLRYRYPCGESYIDICNRLMEVMPTMLTTDNLLVIAHQAVLRCLVNFLRKKDQKLMPYEKIPLHTLFKVTLDEDGINLIEEVKIAVECVDTYRPKPSNCRVDRSFAESISSVPAHL